MPDVFDQLDGKLKQLVRKRFPRPTKIQEEAVPLVLKGRNLLLISETGSGKTESVLLPVFNQFLKKETKPISILYITPLKSLNRDLLKRILWWGKELDFEVSVRHGDTSQYERTMQAANPSDMMISTPETLQSILVGKIMRDHLKNVKWVIVDEIHELVDNKRGVQLSVALERLKKIAGNFQMIGLSATVGSPQRVASFLGTNFQIIDAAKEKTLSLRVDIPPVSPEDRLVSRKMFASPETVARVREMRDIIIRKNSVLVFTNTRETAEILSSRLKVFDPSLPLETHHSSLSKEVRIRAETEFKEQRLKALLCTSSLELGIDIGAIDFVVQYMSPRQVMKLLQRVGRAGHSIDRRSEGCVMGGDSDDLFESSVITARALRREIEETAIYTKAFDVLGHQIVGLTLEYYNMPMDEAFQLIKNSYPYRTLTEGEFLEVCKLMERLRVLWINDKEWDKTGGDSSVSGAPLLREDRFKGKTIKDFVLKRRKTGWVYYYQNLSTIPDVKNYKVQDVFSSQPVGSLDAEFIALHGNVGQGVIIKGQAWKILDVGNSKVMVEPMSGIEAAIPAWEGELIPVPFEVAQGVGALRREIAEKIKEKKPVSDFLVKTYPISKKVSAKLEQAVRNQLDWGFLPTDKELLIEYDSENIVIHTCWGSLVNDTIGRVLSVLLTERLGSVGLNTDPYRIVLKTTGWGWKEAAEVFMDLRPEKIEPILRGSLPHTEVFHWKFLHAAQRLGIISRDAEFGKGYLKKIVEVYSGTPVYEEAMNEVFQDKLDIEKTAIVLEKLRKKEMTISIREGLSPLARIALAKRYEIVPPERPDKEIFEIFKNRLLETKVGMVCCNCGKWANIIEVEKIPSDITCSKCKAKVISIVPKRYILDAQQLILKKINGGKFTGEEQRWLDLTMDTASLVVAHGKEAAIALAGHGVGVKTAGRILSKMHTGDELMKSVLQAERNYIKTRRFWSD